MGYVCIFVPRGDITVCEFLVHDHSIAVGATLCLACESKVEDKGDGCDGAKERRGTHRDASDCWDNQELPCFEGVVNYLSCTRHLSPRWEMKSYKNKHYFQENIYYEGEEEKGGIFYLE